MDLNSLRQFLLDSNKAGYASGEEKKWIQEKNGSTTIPFSKGEWSCHDNFFGGEPYGGRNIVFYKNKPVWIMVYYGWVTEGVKTDPVYAVLRSALMHMPEDAPFRGPKKYNEGIYHYTNTWTGTIERYFGEESITEGDKLVYHANYMGGLVDKGQGV